MFDRYQIITMKIDDCMVYSSIGDLLASDRHNYNSEDFLVFDVKAFTRVEEIFYDKCPGDWVSVILSNNRNVALTEDQEVILPNGSLIKAKDLKRGQKLYWCEHKIPLNYATLIEIYVAGVESVYPRDGYELMTESKSYIAGGIQIASF